MTARATQPPISVAAVAVTVVLSLVGVSLSAQATTTVTVLRDSYGVPHIRSNSDIGAFYGLGWAAAQDRLLHMNLNVWTVQGRMAEALGSDWIEQDRYWRIVGMWRHAQEVAGRLDLEHRTLLQAYSNGVNDWLAAHPNEINPLFDDLGMAPETWSPAHCIAAWWRVANLFISDPFKKASGYYDFVDRVAEIGLEPAIQEYLGNRHPGDPAAGVVQAEDVPQEVQDAIHAYAESLGYGDDAKGFARFHPDNYGHASPSFSHAWVVGGDRTTTGAAVLISDPQITVSFPNLFYEWHASGSSFNVRGIGVPGAAGLLIGFNEHLAWGLTAAGADQRDLMRLEMVDRNVYRVDGVEYNVQRQTETLLVKDADDESVTWRGTLWGPIVTSLVNQTRPGDEFALKGVPYCEPDRDTFEAMVAMMRADNMSEFRAALDDWRFPSANIVVGDDQGNIFFTLLGALPVRSASSPLGGMIAQEGSSLSYDWQDTVPGIYKPWVLNPGDGFVLSGNHRAAGDWYPIKLGMGFIGTGDTVRSRRLRELLSILPTPATPSEILDATQYDCVNAAKRDMVTILRHAGDQGAVLSDIASLALDHLETWSATGGEVLTSSPGVLLVSKIDTMFRVVTTGEVLHDEFGGGQGGLNFFCKTMLERIDADPQYQLGTDAVSFLDNALADAWSEALEISTDPADWDPWYVQSGAASPTLSWFAGSYLLGAGYASGESLTPPTLQCADGATIWSQRAEVYTQFVDLDAIDQSLSVIPPGNTEGPDDSFWIVNSADWSDGVLHPAPLSDAAVDAIATQEITLEYTPPPGSFRDHRPGGTRLRP